MRERNSGSTNGESEERKLEGSDTRNKHDAFILDGPVGRKESEGQKTMWTGSWTQIDLNVPGQ